MRSYLDCTCGNVCMEFPLLFSLPYALKTIQLVLEIHNFASPDAVQAQFKDCCGCKSCRQIIAKVCQTSKAASNGRRAIMRNEITVNYVIAQKYLKWTRELLSQDFAQE